jgi:hypothetical protein
MSTPSDSPIKLLILGAGCSCEYGYPLASQTREHLRKFGEEIKPTAPKIAGLVEETLMLFEQLEQKGFPAQTLDDLALHIRQGALHATGSQDNCKRILIHNPEAEAISSRLKRDLPSSLARRIETYPQRFGE